MRNNSTSLNSAKSTKLNNGKSTKLNTIKTRYRGAILGTAIGDALGAPFEHMSSADIISQFPTLTGYVDPKAVVRGHKIRRNAEKLGGWTDDTQLMKPILLSIANLGYINPLDIARFNEKIMREEPMRGWGGSHKESVKRFAEGVCWLRASDCSIGTGNGVAMKAAPMGCYLSAMKDRKEFYNAINSIIVVGKTTHSDVGIIAGVLQSVLVALSINGIRNTKDILNTLSSIENDFFGETKLTDKLRNAVKLGYIGKIAQFSGVSGKATESWITAAASFLITKKRKDALRNLSVLIQEGGDTDTLGSMYGALIGARWGMVVFSKELKKGVEQSSRLLSMANDLFHAIEDVFESEPELEILIA